MFLRTRIVGPIMSGEPSLEGRPESAPRTQTTSYVIWKCFFVDGCGGLRQGCLKLGSPTLRPLSELLDIVVQLLIGCLVGIGQPFVPVVAGSPHIRTRPPGWESRTPARSILHFPEGSG